MSPDPENDDRYFNFEINPVGSLYLSIGNGRFGRQFMKETPESCFQIRTSVPKASLPDYHDGFWTVEYAVPLDFIQKYFNRFSFSPGGKLRANFYKCGDGTQYPHFGCWNPISAADYPNPDFHRPESFGWLRLE